MSAGNAVWVDPLFWFLFDLSCLKVYFKNVLIIDIDLTGFVLHSSYKFSGSLSLPPKIANFVVNQYDFYSHGVHFVRILHFKASKAGMSGHQ